jgi:hypothetical protein
MMSGSAQGSIARETLPQANAKPNADWSLTGQVSSEVKATELRDHGLGKIKRIRNRHSRRIAAHFEVPESQHIRKFETKLLKTPAGSCHRQANFSILTRFSS